MGLVPAGRDQEAQQPAQEALAVPVERDPLGKAVREDNGAGFRCLRSIPISPASKGMRLGEPLNSAKMGRQAAADIPVAGT